MNDNERLATIPFWKHEYEKWLQKKTEKKIIIAAATALIINNLAWIYFTKKH